MLSFKGACFNSPTDLRAGTNNWNTASLFIKMRYISIFTLIEKFLKPYSFITSTLVKL